MCYADIVKGIKSVETCDVFKRELKKYFYSENIEFEAYKKVLRLKHERWLREYVNEYFSLMLKIPNMSERESLFGFFDDIQP